MRQKHKHEEWSQLLEFYEFIINSFESIPDDDE